jgi:IPT/TIG domain
MAKEPADRPTDGTTLVTALNSAAAGAYGPDWHRRGRSHLAEAALLLAALWPAGAPPAVGGSTVEQVPLGQRRRRRRVSAARAAIAAATVIAVAAAATALATTGKTKLSASTHPTTVQQVSLQPSLPVPSSSLNPSPTPAASSTSPSPSPSSPPAITGISPTSGTTAGGTVVVITGTGLAGATGVSFGGVAATITADPSTTLTVKSPPGKGTVNITVTTPAGTSAVTAADQFTYKAPPPAVSGVSPSSGPLAGGTVVTITGTGLAGATGVSFGGVAATISADSATKITVKSPAGKAGTVNITVTTPAGTSAVTSADQFTYAPPPVINDVKPDEGPPAGGTTVTITGTGLADATSVTFGSADAKIVSDSATTIVVTSPAGTNSVPIFVTTPGGTDEASESFTYSEIS